jgi:hypothetical protein
VVQVHRLHHLVTVAIDRAVWEIPNKISVSCSVDWLKHATMNAMVWLRKCQGQKGGFG